MSLSVSLGNDSVERPGVKLPIKPKAAPHRQSLSFMNWESKHVSFMELKVCQNVLHGCVMIVTNLNVQWKYLGLCDCYALPQQQVIKNWGCYAISLCWM